MAIYNGNLITNGGFEAGLLGWTHNNVGLTGVDGPLQFILQSHEGLVAAALGANSNTEIATLSQVVPVTLPQFYKLYFHVSDFNTGTTDLEVTVEWLGFGGAFLGNGLLPSPLS